MTIVRNASAAAQLSAVLGQEVTAIDGGFRVKETATHWIDVQRMIFNWRISTTPKSCPLTYDRNWCYFGTGIETLLRAVGAASEWDGADDTDPPGWSKNVQTGEIRQAS